MKKFGKLNSVRFGLTGGFILALVIFFTLISTQLFSDILPNYVGLIVEVFSLFDKSFGIMLFLGTIDAFIEGFIVTWLFAVVYNKLLDVK